MLDLWTWHGRVGRKHYLTTGLILFVLKHNIDRALAAFAGYSWSPFSYWVFMGPDGIESLNSAGAMFYNLLILVAIPFMWIGTVLTLRRLRDAGWPLWLVILFFVPFLNVIFFVVLVAAPSREQVDDGPKLGSPIGRLIPQSELGSAALGIALTVLLAVIEIVISTNGLGNYGWGLFVGIPFFLGLNSTMIYGFHYPRSLGRCLLVSLFSVGLVGAALLGFAIEGVICLAMALPLAIPLALFGGLIGYVLQKRVYQTNTLRVASAVCLLMPGLILVEYGIGETPPLYEVKTSVVIKSDLQSVWTHVVTFSQLATADRGNVQDWHRVSDSRRDARSRRGRGATLRIFHGRLCRADYCVG